MRRREFTAALSVAAVWPSAARAEKQTLPLIRYVGYAFAGTAARRMRALQVGLDEAGFAAGKKVTIDFRWAETRIERVADFVTDLVRRGAKVIVTDGLAVTFAAKPVLGMTP